MKRVTLRATALSVARQFGGALSRQAAVPLGICGVGSRRAADVANQPIVGRLGRVPELGTYCGHRHVGVFVKCPQENGVLVTEGAVETAAPQTGHCDQVIERCAGIPVGPELIAGGLNDLIFNEFPRSRHATMLTSSELIVQKPINALPASRSGSIGDDEKNSGAPTVRGCGRRRVISDTVGR